MSLKNFRILIAGLLLLFSITKPAHAAAYVEGAVTDGGSISGKLSFDGALPEDGIERITISKNPDVCDDEGTGYRVDYVQVQARSNVAVRWQSVRDINECYAIAFG